MNYIVTECMYMYMYTIHNANIQSLISLGLFALTFQAFVVYFVLHITVCPFVSSKCPHFLEVLQLLCHTLTLFLPSFPLVTLVWGVRHRLLPLTSLHVCGVCLLSLLSTAAMLMVGSSISDMFL